MMCGLGHAWFPIGVCILMSCSILVTYTIAVLNGDVEALFPYISDAGADLPESAIFGQFLNVAAVVSCLSLIIRFMLIERYVGPDDKSFTRLYKPALFLGILACFGLSLVGNFQDDKLPIVHFTGAALTFFLGGAYCFLDTAITYKMAPTYNSYYIGHVRLSIAILGVIGLVTTGVGGAVATREWDTANITDHGRKHWQPEDPGYSAHLASTFGEWIMAAAFILYFASFIGDFRKIDVDVTLKSYVAHLSDPVPASSYSPTLPVKTDEPSETSPLVS